MKKLFLLILIGIVSFGLMACSDGSAVNGSEDDSYVLKFAHVASPKSIKGVAADKFAELVEEKTDGKVKVEVYPSSQLYGDQDELDALMSGNVQMIAPSVSKLVKLDPRWQFADMPFLFKDSEHLHRFFQSELGESLLNSDALVNNGIVGVAFWENGFKNFSNNEKKLMSPADFSGMKFRAQAGKVLETQFNSLGAGSTTVAWGETYSALQQGVADGAEATANMMETASFHEVQDHLTISEHGRVDYAVLVNKDFWEGLPDDVREQVADAMKEATDYEWGIAQDFNNKSLEVLKNSDMEVTELSDAEIQVFRDALQPVYDEFTEVITPEIIDGIEELE